VLAFALASLIAGTHPPIKHPPDVNLTPEVESRIYAAIDNDHMTPTAIEITTLDAFDINMHIVLVFGPLKKSSSSVCRGVVVTYEQNETSQAWQRVPLGAYAVTPAANCQAPPKTASRIIIEEKTTDSDVTGIVGAIRAGRTAGKVELPPFTKTAVIPAIRVRGGQAVATITSPADEEKSLLMIRTAGQWAIAAVGNSIALPD
jgi:hypothetical protein